MRRQTALRPAAASGALAFATSVLGRGSCVGAEAGPAALVYLYQPARQAIARQQQVKIQHTVKMMLQAYLRGRPQPRRSPSPSVLVSQVVQSVLPRLVKGLGDHVLRHVRRASPVPPCRVPGRDRDVQAGLASYRPERSVALAFRRDSRSPAELQHQVQRITRHVQSRVAHQITQALPWRNHLNEALRSPEVLRQLTDQLSRAIGRHADIERYRRGG